MTATTTTTQTDSEEPGKQWSGGVRPLKSGAVAPGDVEQLKEELLAFIVQQVAEQMHKRLAAVLWFCDGGASTWTEGFASEAGGGTPACKRSEWDENHRVEPTINLEAGARCVGRGSEEETVDAAYCPSCEGPTTTAVHSAGGRGEGIRGQQLRVRVDQLLTKLREAEEQVCNKMEEMEAAMENARVAQEAAQTACVHNLCKRLKHELRGVRKERARFMDLNTIGDAVIASSTTGIVKNKRWPIRVASPPPSFTPTTPTPTTPTTKTTSASTSVRAAHSVLDAEYTTSTATVQADPDAAGSDSSMTCHSSNTPVQAEENSTSTATDLYSGGLPSYERSCKSDDEPTTSLPELSSSPLSLHCADTRLSSGSRICTQTDASHVEIKSGVARPLSPPSQTTQKERPADNRRISRRGMMLSTAKSLPLLPIHSRKQTGETTSDQVLPCTFDPVPWPSEHPCPTQMSVMDSSENDSAEQHIILNVGGQKFETFRSTLTRYPDTLLGVMFSPRNEALTALTTSKHSPWESDSSGDDLEYDNSNSNSNSIGYSARSVTTVRRKDEYFFDRSYESFEGILQYYRTGYLECPLNVPPSLWRGELDYWHMPLLDEATRALEGPVANDEPGFVGQKAEWWSVFKELHPIKSCLEVKLDTHSVTPVHFNRREGLLTFVFDQRGQLVVGVDGIIIQGSWYARERTQVKSLTFKKIHWARQEVAQYRIVWTVKGDHFPRVPTTNAPAAVGHLLMATS
eukprot:TRINITY_DN1738_c0_g1_i1.p1 TRINITY_DN1738_c0_g1~~TRINITY_DN1738_c0_g1_i1.p1  ORF type:complete len:800 (-),score=118.38 TRINITY_DN1738_c0_g1_i1:87-2315(-)